eukprot:3384693-Rhodomonas_salina.2
MPWSTGTCTGLCPPSASCVGQSRKRTCTCRSTAQSLMAYGRRHTTTLWGPWSGNWASHVTRAEPLSMSNPGLTPWARAMTPDWPWTSRMPSLSGQTRTTRSTWW